LNLTGKKRIERLRRRHYDTLLATRCNSVRPSVCSSIMTWYHFKTS